MKPTSKKGYSSKRKRAWNRDIAEGSKGGKSRKNNPRTSSKTRNWKLERAAGKISGNEVPEDEALKQARIAESFFTHTLSLVALLDRDFNFLRVNEAYAQADHRAVSDFPGHNHFEFYPSEARAIFEQVVKDKTPYRVFGRPFVYAEHPERGTTYWDWTLVPMLDHSGEVEMLIFMLHDVTGHKCAEKKVQQSLERLLALRDIDKFILSSVDMQINLNALLLRAKSLLGVDAAAILLLDPASYLLEYDTGIGFRSETFKSMRLKWGENYAGRVASEQQIIQAEHSSAGSKEIFPGYMRAEGFVHYLGAPLIAKGKVIGVFEVFHRLPFEPDEEWLDFFNSLANQAAIAIEDAKLFSELETSNKELSLAYEATIEGWSHALDLRDKETEGHTQRVTDLTLKLARLVDFPEDQMVQLRRGALLHDIGKMGVPDQILLKPETLTSLEWEIMKMHPSFAFDLLSPIHYLKSAAIDIPYCHHEKWDGSGYPRGLKGGQIPLAARIFALADVWDALTSDRPYRPAWSKEKTLDYIKEQSGKHFDPQIVPVFLSIV